MRDCLSAVWAALLKEVWETLAALPASARQLRATWTAAYVATVLSTLLSALLHLRLLLVTDNLTGHAKPD